MTLAEAMAELERAGTAQNRKVYARHGVGEPMFGVSYAELGRLAKAIKQDDALAVELWETGNHDARVLATMIAEPARTDAERLERWAAELDNYVLTDALSKLAAKSAAAESKMVTWMEAEEEWLGRLGWLIAAGAAGPKQSRPEGHYRGWLSIIEQEIHRRPNRTRDAMLYTLIAIGIRTEELRAEALAAAARIGPVEVDHGETGCKTPEPAEYIERAWQRKKRR